MQKLPKKIKIPASGSLSWMRCYFAVGDKVQWVNLKDQRHTGTIAKVQVNRFGRVSYRSDRGELILTEYVAEAMNRKAGY
jgi:plastocyanin